MALKGTLKDFGIADILQLIGQQQKTGTLHLKAKDQRVQVSFTGGNIVRAESTTRNKKDLIGAMLTRAELISDHQLTIALETQKRTLQRLGDVLVSLNAITADKFKQMVQLQTTETLYKLFTWKNGNYEFEQTDVEADPAFAPLRAESVLMEGFRMVDEWPVVKKKITSYDMTFQRVNELPPAPPKANEFDDALDDAFGEKEEKPDKSGLGDMERRVYALASPNRTVRQLIDLSCFGEFDTCKSLSNLISLEYLRAVPATSKGMELDREETFLESSMGALGRASAMIIVVACLAFVATRVDVGAFKMGGGATSASTYTDPAAQRFVSRQQMTRIEAALGLYRLEKGELPDKLDVLVDNGLLARDDLRYPWRDGYFYRRTETGSFVLLPPLR